jgi:hypothetical protein
MENTSNITRESYRITRCCGNCKFYWYYKGNQRRGNCRLGSEYARTKATGQARTDHDNKKRWPTTYSTCVCDFHIIKSRVWSLAKVTDYCGAKLEDG